MRTKKALWNTSSSLLLELVTVISGFIIPRLILSTFGSSYNGITTSISQFLGYIALLRSGIGGITRASLYKPLSEKDTIGISSIIAATEKYMQRVALFFAGSLVVFAACYPFLINDQFPWFFSFSLVCIIGISTFSQYYFGFTYQMLLQADQSQYITSIIQIVTTILNTLVAYVLIKSGFGIHIVKLGSAIVFAANPIFLGIYVRKKYHIIRNVTPDKRVLKQRWNSFAHQIANFVHGNTDVVILTIMSTLSEVSVYSVYSMVVIGVRKLVNTLSTGMEAAFGNMIAKGEEKVLRNNVEFLEFFIFYAAGFLFSCAIVLIVAFVDVYTNGVVDVDYHRPAFGVILCLAEFFGCIRIPYQSVVLAAGKYKETRNGAIAEPIINIIVSLILVHKYGIVGVAIGTLVAMVFRTIQYSLFMSKHVVIRPLSVFAKKIVEIMICMIIACALSFRAINFTTTNYIDWLKLAVFRGGIISAVFLVFVMLFRRKELRYLLKKIRKVCVK